MKRFLSIALAVLLVAAMLAGCGQSAKQPNDKLSIVCTIFPEYDWVRQILGDGAGAVDLSLLINSKVDLHNFQPSVDDIVKISTCDLFIYVGGESDDWVDDVLAQAANPNMIVINLIDTLGSSAREEELRPGMQAEDEEEGDEVAFDEHVWLSLKNAEVFCAAIADALGKLDPDHAEKYQDNLTAYTAKLSALDAQYKAAVSAAPVKTLLFGDRFPFRYLTEDYGLEYYAAFLGCSAETEASFDTIAALAKTVDALGLRTIMVTETADQSIANTIIKSTANHKQQILVLNAMQSVIADDIQNGATYLSIMESNLDALQEALK